MPRISKRRLLAVITTCTLLVGLVVAGIVWQLSATSLKSTSRTTTTDMTVTNSPASRVKGFYLDIGASSSLGIQAIPTRTEGYSNDLVSLEAARGVALTLTEVGCPGETADSILLRGAKSRIRLMQGRCYHGRPAQLAQATTYLKAHRSLVGVVTIDIGFNDVRTCLNASRVNQPCFVKNLALVQLDSPKLIADLRNVAGSRTHFVGLEYADPFLQHYLSGPSGRVQSALSLRDIDTLNAALVSIYRSGHVAVADVPAQFQSANTSPVAFKPFGVIPDNVKKICQLTWMCSSAHNDHANQQGYEGIAAAILRALPVL